MIYVITNKHTKEVLAVIGDIADWIIQKDIEVREYDGTEPVFTDCTDIDGKIRLAKNKYIIGDL